MRFVMTRTIDTFECPWLDATIIEGETLYPCHKPTYGCIGPNGVAATYDPNGDYPFFEVPRNAIRKVV